MRLSLLLALALLLVFPLPAYADGGGEAGLVIQHGDGTIHTYCVPFTGDSINGADLLKKANVSVVQFSGLVCAIGSQERGEGCFQPTSVQSCVCKSYPPDSTYWAFFTQQYGKTWVYSAVGFDQAAAKDGDMQAWKWGKGGLSSAPAPVAITFEQVCGHAPRVGAQPASLSPTPIPQPTPTAPVTPAVASPATATTTATAAPPAASATREITPLATAPLASPTATFTIISHGTATAVPAPPATGSKSGGSGSRSLLGFVAIAAALVAAIGGALWWRRSHGA